MNRPKLIIVFTLLILALIASYAMPRAQYVGTNFISTLKVPLKVADWTGKDVKEKLNLDFDKDWNRFISEAMIHEYKNPKGQQLSLIMLDAGNFHHPNVCFTAAGFEIKELKSTEFDLPGRTVKAHTLFTTKEGVSNISFYWIIIDKKVIHSWIGQKYKQLFYSLFNRQRIGLMVRIDVPTEKKNIKEAVVMANQFLNSLSAKISKEKIEYIFGN